MFIESVSQMKVNGQEVDFATYASKWIKKVNRGWLFEVKIAHLLCSGCWNFWSQWSNKFNAIKGGDYTTTFKLV